MYERTKASAGKSEVKQINSASRTHKASSPRSIHSPIDYIMHLQSTIGNQAVQRLFKSGAIQAKLKIGQPNDQYEQEADRVADTVMRMPDSEIITGDMENPQSNRGIHIQRMCAECEDELKRKSIDEEEEEVLRAKEETGQTPEVTPSLETRINTARNNGRPLPESTRTFFESRFDHDFSHVRVHTDTRAAETAHSLSARAYTLGQDIVFGSGQYQPETKVGKHLIAHELTHVVQQGGAIQRKLSISNMPTPRIQMDRAELKEGPKYNPTGTINAPAPAGGGAQAARFRLSAKFKYVRSLNVKPSCGEIRQDIMWTNSRDDPGHPGFPGGLYRQNTWYEDRDGNNYRYGHRNDTYTDSGPGDAYYRLDGTTINQATGSIYKGEDNPNDPAGTLIGKWKFRLSAIDTCNNDQQLGDYSYVTVDWSS